MKMNRECPVCNSDVPADGRCCNVKCEAYSHRVFDEIKKTCEPYESEWKTEYLTELPEQDSIVAPSEMFEQASKEFHVNIKMDGETIPVNINDIGFEVCPEFKQKKQEIDKLHSEIVEAQKELKLVYGKLLIGKWIVTTNQK